MSQEDLSMSVKVVILRRVPIEKERELRPLLIKIRSLALAQPGYISGETLMNAEDPTEYLVLSSWKSLKHWNDWVGNSERASVQGEIDNLLGERTMYQVYYSG
jgi:heme-degrading monooxygenase HmoA